MTKEVVFSVQINLSDLYEDGDLSAVFFEELKRAVLKEIRSQEADKYLESVTSEIVEEAKCKIEETVKSKVESFLHEDIALTDRWGKTVFLGDVSDLIKKQIDEILLHPVDKDGRPLRGACTSDGNNWITWYIGKELQNTKREIVDYQISSMKREISASISEYLEQEKVRTIKEEVFAAMDGILKK